MKEENKKEIKTNEEMLEKLQEFCKINNLDIENYEVIKNYSSWKIILNRKF